MPSASGQPKTVIWWVRRDLRLTDNQALHAALSAGERLVPVFIIDPAWMDPPAPLRQGFLWAGLRQLDADLRARGSRLILREGRPAQALSQLVAETGAQAIFAEEDYHPYALQRDREVRDLLPVEWVPGLTVHHPTEVTKGDGSPYTIFTPFSWAWRALPLPPSADLLPAPGDLPVPPGELSSLAFPPDRTPAAFPAGESEARRRLVAFTSGPILKYAEARDQLSAEGTSLLSPYLRFGMISARQAVVAAQQAAASAPTAADRQGAGAWLNELIWREFYNAILYHFPDVLQHAFRADLRDISWADDAQAFAAWQSGQTGYPVVDAAMRQLRQTGWMHNRARMIAASFLVKDLLLNWQLGESWFMECLVDGDPAANNGGWQWTAGVGTDAAPYFRVFNPVLQGQKFDPEGIYVRRWVPELAHVPSPLIHAPWRMPQDMQQKLGCIVGRDYPAPCIDHQWARQRTLRAYRQGRDYYGQRSEEK